jgi:hypothetical protein
MVGDNGSIKERQIKLIPQTHSLDVDFPLHHGDGDDDGGDPSGDGCFPFQSLLVLALFWWFCASGLPFLRSHHGTFLYKFLGQDSGLGLKMDD